MAVRRRLIPNQIEVRAAGWKEKQCSKPAKQRKEARRGWEPIAQALLGPLPLLLCLGAEHAFFLLPANPQSGSRLGTRSGRQWSRNSRQARDRAELWRRSVPRSVVRFSVLGRERSSERQKTLKKLLFSLFLTFSLSFASIHTSSPTIPTVPTLLRKLSLHRGWGGVTVSDL